MIQTGGTQANSLRCTTTDSIKSKTCSYSRNHTVPNARSSEGIAEAFHGYEGCLRDRRGAPFTA